MELELVVREVKWIQKNCSGGSAHDQLIGALFGRMKVGGLPVCDSLDAAGKLLLAACPYAHKFINNLNHYRCLESAREFFAAWASADERADSLFLDEELKELLGRISSKELKTVSGACVIAGVLYSK